MQASNFAYAKYTVNQLKQWAKVVYNIGSHDKENIRTKLSA
jgi:hypothetical protein